MKTRTGIHAGANEPTADISSLQGCKQQKDYWQGQALYMENKLASCRPSYPTYPTYPTYPSYPTNPTSGGGYSGGVWYPDRSGLCG
jgi:hypothetical protein